MKKNFNLIILLFMFDTFIKIYSNFIDFIHNFISFFISDTANEYKLISR